MVETGNQAEFLQKKQIKDLKRIDLEEAKHGNDAILPFNDTLNDQSKNEKNRLKDSTEIDFDYHKRKSNLTQRGKNTGNSLDVDEKERKPSEDLKETSDYNTNKNMGSNSQNGKSGRKMNSDREDQIFDRVNESVTSLAASVTAKDYVNNVFDYIIENEEELMNQNDDSSSEGSSESVKGNFILHYFNSWPSKSD